MVNIFTVNVYNKLDNYPFKCKMKIKVQIRGKNLYQLNCYTKASSSYRHM